MNIMNSEMSKYVKLQDVRSGTVISIADILSEDNVWLVTDDVDGSHVTLVCMKDGSMIQEDPDTLVIQYKNASINLEDKNEAVDGFKQIDIFDDYKPVPQNNKSCYFCGEGKKCRATR